MLFASEMVLTSSLIRTVFPTPVRPPRIQFYHHDGKVLFGTLPQVGSCPNLKYIIELQSNLFIKKINISSTYLRTNSLTYPHLSSVVQLDGPSLFSEITNPFGPRATYYAALPSFAEVFSYYKMPLEYSAVVQHAPTVRVFCFLSAVVQNCTAHCSTVLYTTGQGRRG